MYKSPATYHQSISNHNWKSGAEMEVKVLFHSTLHNIPWLYIGRHVRRLKTLRQLSKPHDTTLTLLFAIHKTKSFIAFSLCSCDIWYVPCGMMMAMRWLLPLGPLNINNFSETGLFSLKLEIGNFTRKNIAIKSVLHNVMYEYQMTVWDKVHETKSDK